MGMLFELRIVLYLFRCDGSTVGHWYGFLVFGLCFFILSAQYSLGYFNFKAFAEKNVFKELNKQILFNHFHSRHPTFPTSPSPSTTPCPISSPSTSPQPNIISQCSPHKPNYFAGLPAGEFTNSSRHFSKRLSASGKAFRALSKWIRSILSSACRANFMLLDKDSKLLHLLISSTCLKSFVRKLCGNCTAVFRCS